jgi:alkylmercury lyase
MAFGMDETHFEQLSAAVLALFPPLGANEQRIGMALYRLLAAGAPVAVEALAAAVRMEPATVEAALAARPDVHRDSDRNITGFGGLTVNETKHCLRIDGQPLYTWCAWDTLFIPPLLGATAKVGSSCAASGEGVSLTVHPERIECEGRPPLVSLVAPDPQAAQTDLVRHFCCHVHFLAAAPAAAEWAATHPETHLATLEQAWQLGHRHNALRYAVQPA